MDNNFKNAVEVKVVAEFDVPENVSYRVYEISKGFSVGVWDKTAGMGFCDRIFPNTLPNAKERAIAYAQKMYDKTYKGE
jgi:hypothetical protein